MWPFRKCDCQQRIRDLKQERDQAEDAYMSVVQAKGAAEIAMREMQKAMTDDGVAEIARGVTARIADIYAAGGRSVGDRNVAVHAVVAEAVRKTANGEKHWNEGALARKAWVGKR